MTYFILCNGIPLPDNSMKKPLEFKTKDEAGEYIADLDGENTLSLQVKPVKNPSGMRKLFKSYFK